MKKQIPFNQVKNDGVSYVALGLSIGILSFFIVTIGFDDAINFIGEDVDLFFKIVGIIGLGISFVLISKGLYFIFNASSIEIALKARQNDPNGYLTELSKVQQFFIYNPEISVKGFGKILILFGLGIVIVSFWFLFMVKAPVCSLIMIIISIVVIFYGAFAVKDG